MEKQIDSNEGKIVQKTNNRAADAVELQKSEFCYLKAYNYLAYSK